MFSLWYCLKAAPTPGSCRASQWHWRKLKIGPRRSGSGVQAEKEKRAWMCVCVCVITHQCICVSNLQEGANIQVSRDIENGILFSLQAADLTAELQTISCGTVLVTHTHTHRAWGRVTHSRITAVRSYSGTSICWSLWLSLVSTSLFWTWFLFRPSVSLSLGGTTLVFFCDVNGV